MKKYRFIYWLGSMRTEWICRARNLDEAFREFEKRKSGCRIWSVEEV